MIIAHKVQRGNASPTSLTLCLGLLACLFGNISWAIDVYGTSSIEMFGIGDGSKRHEREFSVNIGDNTRWDITKRLVQQTNGIQYYKSTCDGTNILAFTAFDTSVNQGSTNGSKITSKNDSLGIVRTGNYPPFDSSRIQPIWLEMYSGYYFKQMSNSPAPRFLGVEHISSRRIVGISSSCDWKRSVASE